MRVDTTRRARYGPLIRAANVAPRLLLHAPLLRRLLDRSVCELRFITARSRRRIALPVGYAQHGDRIVVLVGGAVDKLWWRNFRNIRPVRVHLRGVPRDGVGYVVGPGAANRDETHHLYTSRFPHLAVGDDPFVVIDLSAADERSAAPTGRGT